VLIAAMVATVAMAGFAADASAHNFRAGAQHTLQFDPATDDFSGELSSSVASCERSRSITVYRETGDAPAPLTDTQVGTTATDADGTWSATVADASPDDYYAVAAKKVKKRPGHRHICKKAMSNEVTVVPRADLVLSNRISGPFSNRNYVYEANLANEGPQAAADIVLSVTVPANFEVTSSQANCTPQTGTGVTLVCDSTGSSMPAGSPSWDTLFLGHFTSGSEGTFDASVSSATSDPVPGNNDATLSETPPACADYTDNDTDGQTDFSADAGCASATDESEAVDPLCSDETDNDTDGQTDYPDDPGCESAADNDETDPADVQVSFRNFGRDANGVYTIGGDFQNNGPGKTTIQFTIDVPANFTVTEKPPYCSQVGSALTCNTGSNFSPGGSGVALVKGTFSSATSGTFTISATGSAPDPDPSNNSSELTISNPIPP
jgi:hypothetical protein